MGTPAIEVEGLGKRYRIGAAVNRHRTIRDALVSHARLTVNAVGRRLRGDFRRRTPETVWALRDVDFSVEHGETVGIIGSNGAGKSTLLKILSRITEPTTGSARIHGRVGSLLEVGTGFHPELTGRENTYLNGAILGMRRGEIDRKFDEIVAFAEVERFIDTPVKHYSTGMQLRLAFAVAAHLEPEILIVDEVLAVGDAAFQRRCLGKMGDVAGSGRTVLFVSHNMMAMRSLCSRCLHLDSGGIVAEGAPGDVVAGYMRNLGSDAAPGQWIDLRRALRKGTGEVRFTSVRFTGRPDAYDGQLFPDGPAEFVCELEADAARRVGSVAVSISSLEGERLVNMDSILMGQTIELHPGSNLIRISTPHLHLQPGTYRVSLWLADPLSSNSGGAPYDYLESAADVEVVEVTPGPTGLRSNSLVTSNFEVAKINHRAGPSSGPARSAAVAR